MVSKYVLIACVCKICHSQKQEKLREASFCEEISSGAKKKQWRGKKLLSVNRFECSVINRTQFKGSGNLRRFLSRLTNFLQHTVSAGRRHLLHIRAAGCLKKKKRHVGGRATPSHPLYRAVFHRKTYICENRALQQILYSSGCHFARKSVFGCLQERDWVFCSFIFATSNNC